MGKEVKDTYDKSIMCPVCRHNFTSKKVRSSAIRVEYRDSDFCTHYKCANPYVYDVWVCDNCGYAATENKFEKIRDNDKKIIKDMVSPKWKKRSYGNERSIQDAIICYKLALYEGNLLNKEKSYIGGICLKIGWLFRYLKNEEFENKFLNHALENLESAFSKESFPILGMDEATFNFLIGELHLRANNYKDAINWFSHALNCPEIKTKRALENTLRDRWQYAAQQNKNV